VVWETLIEPPTYLLTPLRWVGRADLRSQPGELWWSRWWFWVVWDF